MAAIRDRRKHRECTNEAPYAVGKIFYTSCLRDSLAKTHTHISDTNKNRYVGAALPVQYNQACP